MKAKVFVLLIFYFCVSSEAQIKMTKQMLEGVWLIDSGAFPMDIVKLKMYNPGRDSLVSYTGYKFEKDGSIEIVTHVAGKFLFCGNGMPYIKSGFWRLKRKRVRIKIEGGYSFSGTHSYDLAYKASSFVNELLILKKAKTYMNYRCEFCPN